MHDQITSETAAKVLDAAWEKAQELGVPVSVAIVDAGRDLLAFRRHEDAPLASTDISISKAYTARSLNMNTGDLGPLTQPGGLLYGMEHTQARTLVTFAGGRPLQSGESFIGAVGVAGGSPDQDDAIAAAGAEAVQ
jgi:uncharacterized protein GlcG (DUF336 family)